MNDVDTRKLAQEIADAIEDRIGLHYPDVVEIIVEKLTDARDVLVGKWMEDELHDYSMIQDHCSQTYMHFTGGRISKPNTFPAEVFAVAADLEAKEIVEAIADTGYKEALEAMAEALKEPSGGSYEPARALLDRCGVFHDDVNDTRVLGLLAQTVLETDVSARDAVPFQAAASPDEIAAHRLFRELLVGVAPLPWRIDDNVIVDENGNCILLPVFSRKETNLVILGAVICGVSTCGGYRLTDRMDKQTNILEEISEESASRPVCPYCGGTREDCVG